jgi:hypothetical protein
MSEIDRDLERIERKLDQLLEWVGYTDTCVCLTRYSTRNATRTAGRLICERCRKPVDEKREAAQSS